MAKKEKIKIGKKAAAAFKETGERMARRKLLEELFYDFDSAMPACLFYHLGLQQQRCEIC